MKLKFLTATIFCVISSSAIANTISANSAKNYINKKATVCGKIAEVAKVNNDNFINLDNRHPYQTFTFYTGAAEINPNIRGKVICGTGIIIMHKGKPSMVIKTENSLFLK